MDDTVVMVYDLLGEASQQEMVRSAILELERLHFETKLNILVNSPDHTMNFEDGTSQKLRDRLLMVEDKLDRIKGEYREMI